jgi:hypothetical protein
MLDTHCNLEAGVRFNGLATFALRYALRLLPGKST